MKNIIIVFVTAFFTINSFAQSFEGKIVYRNNYKSKMSNTSDKQLIKMMGEEQEYFIKNGDYKSVSNGTFFKWQLYINKENKLYSKMANSSNVFWNDAAINTDEVIKTELNKNVIEILGYKCDELVFTCKKSIQKYYFNTNISVDTSLFTNHKYANWYELISKSKALPLKSIIENNQFSLESTAIEIKEMKLEKFFFELPANTKTVKSPF